MNNNNLNILIKESLKDIAIRICDLNFNDRKSLLAEYKELIIKEIDLEEILMLPYEAYTNRIDKEYMDDSN